PTVPTDLRDWVAVKANVASAALEGVAGVTATGTSLSLELSQGGGTNNGAANTTVVNFASKPLVINAGPAGNITLSYPGASGKILRVHGALNVGFGGFFTSSGTFDFEQTTINIGSTPTAVSKISGTGVTATITAGPIVVTAT